MPENIPADDKTKYTNYFKMGDSDNSGFLKRKFCYLPNTFTIKADKAYILFARSGLPKSELDAIWKLADFDQDQRLSLPQFIIAMHLLTNRVLGSQLPASLVSFMCS